MASRSDNERKCVDPEIIVDPMPTFNPLEFTIKSEQFGQFYSATIIDKNVGTVWERDLWERCACADLCGTDACPNRGMKIECTDCNEGCQNQRIQRKDFAISSLHVILNPFIFMKTGVSLETKEFIAEKCIVGEYLGEVVSVEEYKTRLSEVYDKDAHNYGLKIGSKHIVDATRFGNLLRFANHKCVPTCHVEEWNVGETRRSILVASRDIKAGEEISYDYKFQHFGKPKWGCTCSKKCTQVTCPKCQRKIGTKHGLNQHIAAKHTNKAKGYKCPACPKKFGYKNNLSTHMRKKHKE